MAPIRCGRCHRVLKDPDCIDAGFGRTCFLKLTGKKLGGRKKSAAARSTGSAPRAVRSKTRPAQPTARKTNAPPGPLFASDIVCSRNRRGEPIVNIPQRIVRHSPDGFEWGYHGNGPADLALNVLAMFVDEATADLLHQDFKQEFIVTLPLGGGTIKKEAIEKWLQEKGLL